MDEDAFETVAREQKDRAFSYAARLLGRRADAQDVVQEGLVRLWQHRDRVEDDTARFWLRRTVHNLCIDRLRRRRASPEAEVPVDESLSPDPRGGPIAFIEHADLKAKVISP